MKTLHTKTTNTIYDDERVIQTKLEIKNWILI